GDTARRGDCYRRRDDAAEPWSDNVEGESWDPTVAWASRPCYGKRIMNPSRPFILRPVATSLLMAGILLVGLVAFRQLPVSALPEVDYPTIQVTTFYPGASTDVIASAVTAPLERQLGQVPAAPQTPSPRAAAGAPIAL